MSNMDAFGGFDEGNDEFVLQNPADSQPATEETGDVQFPTSQAQFGAPAMNSGFAQPSEDDDLTEEEKQQVAQVKEAQQTMKASLHEKMLEEQKLRNERKKAGFDAIQTWQTERKGQISLRRQNNQEHEKQFQTSQEDARKGNPWERVADNCDFSLTGTTGGHDKTRMK